MTTVSTPIRTPRRRLPTIAPLVAGLIALSAAAVASAQPHESRDGPYVLRSSTVSSEVLPATTAREHGIVPSPTRAVLNVVVLHEQGQGRADKTVPAKVEAAVVDLTGRRQQVNLREVALPGGVSYVGSYEFTPNQMLEFNVSALPKGHDRPISLKYNDHMVP